MYFENKEFKNLKEKLEIGEYENCKFVHCDFSEQIFNGSKFIDCKFEECNFSLVKVNGCSFQDVFFVESKILGVKFDEALDFGFGVSFTNCQLNHSVFYKKKLKKTKFLNCQLESVDFEQCDLTEAVFKECNLNGATFNKAILNKTDFRTAFNFSIDLELVSAVKTKFSKQNLIGLLDKYKLDIS